MNDLGVIDQFTDVFSRFIDGGFGLLGGEVHFLTATQVAIDMTLAGLWRAMGGRDVLPQLLRKILYVGAFVFIINNFNMLSSIVFRSFAGLGLVASGSPLTQADLFRPGRVAAAGVTAAQPLLTQIGSLTGFPDLFLNLDTIVVLFLAWLVVIVSFFILAVQMFVTLIEFKLTTLAGFVIVPFSFAALPDSSNFRPSPEEEALRAEQLRLQAEADNARKAQVFAQLRQQPDRAANSPVATCRRVGTEPNPTSDRLSSGL